MKKKVKIIALGMALTLMLGGCGNSIADLTEEETKQISEYAAITLLKYDASNRSRLVDLSKFEEPVAEEVLAEPEELPQEQPEEEMEPSVPVIENVPEPEPEKPTATVNSILGISEDFVVTYQGYELVDSYDGGSGGLFSLDAGTGKMLLVLKLALSNLGGEDRYADILGGNVSIRATINGDYTRTALMTMLPNDFATYSGSIAPGGTEYLSLVYEVENEAVSAGIQSLKFVVKNHDGKAEMDLM